MSMYPHCRQPPSKIEIRAGVGETARADARIILEGVKTTFQAPGGLSVQVPAGSNLNTQIQTLARQPGMSYLSSLAARSDVNWQPVKLAFDQWSYSQQGLTPAGAALVAVAVAWATAGQGANFLGSMGSTTTTVGGVATTTYTTAGLMANAAFTSLASQAAITLINNQGNIGKTLSDLASSNTAKAALAAVLTAGAMVKIAAIPGMETLSQSTAFSDKLTFNLINATGRALTSAAIYGGSLESALQTALVSGLVDTAQGAVSSKIKLLEDDYVIHKLAHALAGCVAGAAAGGACRDGAIGAAVGEMVAGLFDKPGINATPAERAAFENKVLGVSKLVAGATSAYAGGNAQTAITTAETAVRNNYLTETQKQKRDRALAACQTPVCAMSVLLKYEGTSALQDTGLLVGVMGGIGYQSAEQIVALVDLAKNIPETLRVLTAIVNDVEFRAKVGDQIANEYLQRIDMQTRAYNEGGWGGSITAGVEAGRLAVDVTLLASAAVGVTKLTAKAASVGGVVVADAATKLAVRGAWVFESLDAASQARWLAQTSSWRAATTELADLEILAGGKSHPLLRHGDQVELSQLQVRALTGMTPDGVQLKAVDSTRWLKNEDMLAAIKQAQAEFKASGGTKTVFDVNAGKVVGEGYYGSSSTYAQATSVKVVLNSKGLPVTAYPVLPKM